jgi:hypothetical protein
MIAVSFSATLIASTGALENGKLLKEASVENRICDSAIPLFAGTTHEVDLALEERASARRACSGDDVVPLRCYDTAAFPEFPPNR